MVSVDTTCAGMNKPIHPGDINSKPASTTIKIAPYVDLLTCKHP